jgi:hypothetical protein
VFGIEDLLEQIHAVLTGWGYRVWMSHKGTIPTDPRRSNEQNCVVAASTCDLFLGIITGRHGSGIFQKEVAAAVSSGRLRWFLVHHDINVARQLLRQYRFDSAERPLNPLFTRTAVLESLEVLATYETAIQHHVPIDQRAGNWAQEFFRNDDALAFVKTQFQDTARVRDLVREHGASHGN